MSFKAIERIFEPDPRFHDLVIIENGRTRRMNIADHHKALAEISLSGTAPAGVMASYDRARNTIIYAFFDYDLFVVGEVQAVGAFELALKHRLNGHGGATRGTLRNLVARARKAGVLPPLATSTNALPDPIEALISIRNELSHGTSDIHSPGMALNVVKACASLIDHLYPPQPISTDAGAASVPPLY